jgi:hypothetical protein
LRKFLPYLLSAFIAFNACGYVFIYYWCNSDCHAEFERAGREKFQTLFVPDKQVEQAQAFRSGEHEWTINGELYDVTSVERVTGGFRLTCFHDSEEETALYGMKKSFDQQLGTGPLGSGNSSKDHAGKDVKYFSAGNKAALTSCVELFRSKPVIIPFHSNPFIGKTGPPPRA